MVDLRFSRSLVQLALEYTYNYKEETKESKRLK